MRYAELVYRDLNPRWNVPNAIGPTNVLLDHLGKGISEFLQRQLTQEKGTTGKCLITKNPSVKGLDRFFKLFPTQRLVIVVRDGRDVVESSVKSFNLSYDEAAKIWAKGAERILRFADTASQWKQQYLIVKYEDLLRTTERTLREIFGFLHLSPEVYDFDAASRLPVFGSSEVRPKDTTAVSWAPLARPDDFDPTHRLRRWGP